MKKVKNEIPIIKPEVPKEEINFNVLERIINDKFNSKVEELLDPINCEIEECKKRIKKFKEIIIKTLNNEGLYFYGETENVFSKIGQVKSKDKDHVIDGREYSIGDMEYSSISIILWISKIHTYTLNIEALEDMKQNILNILKKG